MVRRSPFLPNPIVLVVDHADPLLLIVNLANPLLLIVFSSLSISPCRPRWSSQIPSLSSSVSPRRRRRSSQIPSSLSSHCHRSRHWWSLQILSSLLLLLLISLLWMILLFCLLLTILPLIFLNFVSVFVYFLLLLLLETAKTNYDPTWNQGPKPFWFGSGSVLKIFKIKNAVQFQIWALKLKKSKKPNRFHP